MPDTPFFPAWRRRFHRPCLSGVRATLTGLRRCTLDQLEASLGPLLPGLTALSFAGASARERPYSVRRTWWCFLWQSLQKGVSCRQVVRQLQAMLVLEGRPLVEEGTSAYCQARARVPESLLEAALHVSAHSADQRVAPGHALQGRVIKVIDGTSLTLPDTAQNQLHYPQPRSQKPGCGFPLLHLLVVWSARGAAILDHVIGNHHHGEMRLLHQVCPTLAHRDIVIYDRAAGHYVGCALLQARGADLISRVSGRRIDWRRGRRLGPDERLVLWPRSHQKSPYVTPQEWAALPEQLTVRVIRLRVVQTGFRTRQLMLVTTLLDATAYPAAEIASAYLRRWRVEMCLDDLKTTLGLDALRCQTPTMVHRELLTLLIAHNLIRAVMAQAAADHAVPLERISFKGTLDTLRIYCAACALSPRASRRRLLWSHMLHAIAADLLPLRPDRWEPRAVKRRPKSYPPLSRPRHLYSDIRHGSRYLRPSKKT